MLLREAVAALDAVSAAERRTRRAGAIGGEPRLVLVTKAGASVELLAKLLDAYAAEPEASIIDVQLCGPRGAGADRCATDEQMSPCCICRSTRRPAWTPRS